MPDFEYAVFSTSPAFASAPDATIKPFIDFVIEHGTGKGLLSFHYGLFSEDSSKECLFIGYDTIQSHTAIISVPAIRAEVIRLLSPCILHGQRPDIAHYSFSDSSALALSDVLAGPEPEFAVVSYRPGQTHAEALSAWEDNFLPLLKTTEGWVAGSGPGAGVEKKELFMVAMAWESIELHNKARANPKYKAAAQSMGGALVGFAHVKLVKAC